MQKDLIDWSKWIIAINFSAAIGCIIAFDKSSPALPWPGVPFLLAILFFALNVLVSIIFTLRLTLQTLPEKYYNILGNLQVWLFILALAALSTWIVGKALKKQSNDETVQVVTKEKTAEIKMKEEPVEVTIKLSTP